MPWLSFPWRRESWRVFWRQRSVLIPLAVALIALAANWVIVAATPAATGEARVLRYSVYVGTNWIAPSWARWWPPLVLTAFIGLNVALSYLVARRRLVLQRVWLWSAALLGLGFLWLALLLAWFNI